MEELMLREVERVVADHASGADELDGILYCAFELESTRPMPLYIGKAEKFGKGDGNLSANIDGISAETTHPFARWGYRYAYHLGDLSAVVLEHPVPKSPKYERWATEMFEARQPPTLRRPVYFWCKAWRSSDVGPWREFGPTSLAFAEYQLIGLASALFPRLLNDEGVMRPRRQQQPR
jgi:hypothetical protein